MQARSILALSAIALVVGVASCSLRGSLDDLGSAECLEPVECAGAETECQHRSCDAGRCGLVYPSNTPIEAQAEGDCQLRVCDGLGSRVTVDDETDVIQGSKQCEIRTCSGGTLSTAPTPFEPCDLNGDSGVCDTEGACVECNDTADCADKTCAGETCTCSMSLCVPAHCINLVEDANETDTDCGGGDCPGCDDGDKCEAGNDCLSLVCGPCDGDAGSCCQPPACDDGKANGDETDVDCGGERCLPCDEGSICNRNADCVSKLCDVKTNLCTAALCDDGVMNSAETDIDCGGGKCKKCEPLQFCIVDADCLGNACRMLPAGNQCQPNCMDGFKNNDETGVDCGGATCSPCNVDATQL